jgi:uncharacterized protein with HEPN domain
LTIDQRQKKHPRYLRDIISYGESIIGKLEGVAFDSFARDADLRDLVIYRLQCVSEATKNVLSFDPTIGERHPEIPWRNVRDIGNLLRHEYENVDVEVIWETVTSGELRALVNVAQSELAKLDD